MKKLVVGLFVSALMAGLVTLGASASDGASLYDDNCAACHGGDFVPAVEGAMDLTTFPDDPDRFGLSVREGKGNMPAHDDLTDEDITVLYDYIKSA